MASPSWSARTEDLTLAFEATFGALTPEQLNWKPNPDTWSIGQVIHHLIVINSTYFPVLDALRAGTYRTPWHGRMGFLTRFFGNFVLSSVQPDRKMRIKTFPIWEPATSDIPGDILRQFRSHQQDLGASMDAASDLVSGGAVISSPANAVIVYTLGTAFEIILTHEARHLAQAEELKTLIPH
ncbi:MAG: DinB family protein [Bacteroidia bacterium]|nr:DinB family protein [Bacteroidia bacterium]